MFEKNNFEQINEKVCKAIDTDLNDIGLAFVDSENNTAMEMPAIQDFCRWWVRKHPDKFAALKGCLYQFRADKAKLFNSVGALAKLYNDKKISSPFVVIQLQLLVNNHIDQTNATIQLIQFITKLCEKALSED